MSYHGSRYLWNIIGECDEWFEVKPITKCVGKRYRGVLLMMFEQDCASHFSAFLHAIQNQIVSSNTAP